MKLSFRLTQVLWLGLFVFVFYQDKPDASGPLPMDVLVLTKKDFTGHNYFSVGDLLKGQPSIDIQQQGNRGTQSVAKIRGSSSAKRTLVMLDGVPLNHDFDGAVDLSQIPLNIVDRIEINRGGSSLAYSAENSGGAINIITDRPNEKNLFVQLEAGVGRNGIRSAAGRFKGRSYWGDLTYLTGQQKTGGFLYNEEVQENNHFGNISRSFNGKGHWGVEYYFQESDVGQANGTTIPFDQWNRSLERQPTNLTALRQQETQHVKAELQSPPIGGGPLSFRYFRGWRDVEEWTARDVTTTKDEFSNRDTVTLAWRPGTVDVGIEGQELNRTYTDTRYKTHQSAAYLLKEWGSKTWKITPQARVDHYSNFDNIFSPRVVGALAPSEDWLFSATAGRGLRAPSYEELFQNNIAVPNINLDPEMVWSYDAGLKWIPSSSFQMGMMGFARNVSDLIQVDSNSNQFVNHGSEKNTGLETQLSFEFGKDTTFTHMAFDGNLTFQNSSRDLEGGLGAQESPLTPKRLGLFRLKHFFPRRMTLINEVRTQSEQFELPARQGLRIPSSYVWNIRYQIKIWEMDGYFEVENVTQRPYAEDISTGISPTVLSPQPDRVFFAGFSIRFRN